MTLRVREAGPSDLKAILALTVEDSQHYFDEPDHVTENQRAALAEITADPNQQMLVGEVDDPALSRTVVCTAQVTWMRMLASDGGLYCQVEAVRTAAARRGEGIGAALMTHIEDAARARGAARIQLTSNRARTRAHAFYERLGYDASHVGMKKYL
ncbi:N-acetyltransferase family protein [Aeromicrobium sp. CF3.5]|uniref:GNAT family N-acetyltransferase n=1 Tax=Aeromicrobium sp. CF3.5 TaxID=3373078 RepID=UPI003EE71CC3